MPEIWEDTRQQSDKHEIKHGWWEAHGVTVTRRKLDAGDYMADGSNVTVDTKRNVDELAMNINGKSHDRFKRECQRAAAAGYRLVVLVENMEGYTRLEHVCQWTNGHCASCQWFRRGKCDPHEPTAKCPRHGTRKPIQGPRLAKAMQTMHSRYGVEFRFCKPSESARIVCELLGVDYEEVDGDAGDDTRGGAEPGA